MERTANILVKRSDGKEFDIGQYFKIVAMDGFGRLEPVLFTEEKGQGDGALITSKRIPGRQVTITLTCESEIYEANIRTITNRFFTDRFTYKLYVTYNNVTRWLNAELSVRDLPTANVFRKQDAIISFLCPDPYYHSVDSYDQNIASVMPTFGFPMFILAERSNIDTPAGVSFGVYNFDRNVKVINDGDYPSFFTATITCNEDVTNFKLMQDDFTFVKINGVLKSGTIAKIDLEEASLYIKENEQEGFVRHDNRLSRDSEFFKIPLGESIIKYDAEIGEEAVEVKLTRYINYSGI